MFSIGDFARHGRVSVRMLRHYDAIGLLRPAHVDPSTGYRSYQAAQLSRLNGIVSLKDLGFTLEQVRDIIDDKINVEELRGMLRLRKAKLQSQLAADAARLVQIEARLQIIEREGVMPADEVQIKRIPEVRVAELTGVAASFEPDSIGPVIQPLYDELCARLARAGLTPTGPGVAYYEDAPDGGVIVHAGLPIAAESDLRTRGTGTREARSSPALADVASDSRSPWPLIVMLALLLGDFALTARGARS
jgi:DNA-binding transcriptional MerR regulator